MSRIVQCPCGDTLTGKGDEELFVLAKRHVKEHHADSTRSEEEIPQLVISMATDA